MQDALIVTGLTKRYDDFTLDNVSFTLPSGCIMGFIGENGAGKSTTIKLILDLIRRDGGDISVLGEDMRTGGKSLREHIGVVMEEAGFPDNLSAQDIRKIMARCYRTWDDAQFSRYLSRFSLPSKKAVKEYSRGMKMKLSIAAALSHDSHLLILDEATSGLDPIVRDEILDVFLDFIQDEEHSVFISSHIISDLEKICDYVTLIHKGRIMFSEPKDVLLDKYLLVKCSKAQLEDYDASDIIGMRENSFGAEALVLRDAVKSGVTADRPTIEDIMLYSVKEGLR